MKNLTRTKTVASGKYDFSHAHAHLLYAMLAAGDCGGRLQAGMPYKDVILHFTHSHVGSEEMENTNNNESKFHEIKSTRNICDCC